MTEKYAVTVWLVFEVIVVVGDNLSVTSPNQQLKTQSGTSAAVMVTTSPAL